MLENEEYVSDSDDGMIFVDKDRSISWKVESSSSKRILYSYGQVWPAKKINSSTVQQTIQTEGAELVELTDIHCNQVAASPVSEVQADHEEEETMQDIHMNERREILPLYDIRTGEMKKPDFHSKKTDKEDNPFLGAVDNNTHNNGDFLTQREDRSTAPVSPSNSTFSPSSLKTIHNRVTFDGKLEKELKRKEHEKEKKAIMASLAEATAKEKKKKQNHSHPLLQKAKASTFRLKQQSTSTVSTVVSGIKIATTDVLPKLFSGLSFVYVPTNLEKKLVETQKSLIIKNGGKFVEEAHHATHIISKVPLSRILTFLKLSLLPPHIDIVTNKWVSNCLLNKTLQEVLPYRPVEIIEENLQKEKVEAKTPDESGTEDNLDIGPLGLYTNILSVSSRCLKNKNEHITLKLEEAKAASESGFSKNNYTSAINLIGKAKYRIETVEQVDNFKGIGSTMKKRIKEIIRSKTCSKTDVISELKIICDLFEGIHGVGNETSQRWYQLGHRTLDDIRNKVTNLTSDQKIGLKYYNDINTKIPRADVKRIGETIIEVIKSLDPDLVCEIMGSYRRKALLCGDIDIMVWHPSRSCKGIHLQVVDLLIKHPLFEETIRLSSRRTDGSQWLGLIKFKEYPRFIRLDIFTCEIEYLGGHLLQYTGDTAYNMHLRGKARSKNYSLGNEGLTRLHDNKLVASRTEREILDLLDSPFYPPEERNSTCLV